MSIDVRKRTEEEVRIATMSSGPSVESETEAVPVSAIEEDSSSSSSGGAFSQQKGGSAALALSAMIDAMNTQLEAVKLKRHRAEISIENQSQATTLQAENYINIGRIEFLGGILTGVLGGLGGMASLGGAFSLTMKNYGVNNSVTPLQNELKQLTNHTNALEKAAGAKGADITIVAEIGRGAAPAQLPALQHGQIGKVGANGRLVDATGANRVPYDVNTNTHRLSDELKEAFKDIPADNAEAILHAASNPDTTRQVLEGLKDKMKGVQEQIRLESDKFNVHNLLATQWIGGANALFATAGVSLVRGLFIDPKVKEEEAKQIFNKYSADAASDARQTEAGAAQAREDDFNKTLALLSQMTSADLRA